jgi:hypothetical protein
MLTVSAKQPEKMSRHNEKVDHKTGALKAAALVDGEVIVRQIVKLGLELRDVELQWSTWHESEGTLHVTPSAACTVEDDSKSLWRRWDAWLKHRKTVNMAPEILLSLDSDVNKLALFPSTMPRIISRLSRMETDSEDVGGEDEDEDKDVATAVAQQPLDVQALTFLHLATRQTTPGVQRWIPDDSDKEQRRLRMLWRHTVIVHNAALPIFTRAWLTRVIYENILTAPVHLSTTTSTVAKRERVETQKAREWAVRMGAEMQSRRLTADVHMTLWETDALDGNEKGAAQVIRTLAAIDGNVPFSQANQVLGHMLHLTSLMLLLYEAASPTWSEVSARRRRRLDTMHQLTMNIVLPVLIQIRMSDAGIALQGVENDWRNVLGFESREFPAAVLLSYIVNSHKKHPHLNASKLALDVVDLGGALHVHSTMTVPQIRRVVCAFWALLWIGPLKLATRDAWSEYWKSLGLAALVAPTRLLIVDN